MHPGEIFLAYRTASPSRKMSLGIWGGTADRSGERESAVALVQISQTVTSAVDDWIGDNEQPDDITLVLARARQGAGK